MNQRERLLTALRRGTIDRPPAVVPTQNAVVEIMEQSGFRWPAAQRKAKEMAGLAWACHEIGGIESVRVPFDINVEAEAMGCETRFGEDMDTPPMTKPKTRSEYHQIRTPDPLKDGRMPEVLEAIELLREKTRGIVPLIVALGTPFELLATSLSFEDITEAFFSDPEFVTKELRRMTEIAKSYAREIEKRNPDVLFLADGTSQSLGPRQYAEFSFPYTKELIASFSRPSILHICGNPTPLLEQMAATGADALSIDKPVDIEHALRVTEGKVALVGKISPRTLYSGSTEEIVAETEDSVRQGMHVIAPGCGILPQTPLENLRTYIRTVVSVKRS
ncbi:MAG TPA: MtaA/CmuA family methyltransferase [Thermodesulfovibrionales bacterium]|nr:MtaA/CmuA family methyltransferase [Thermodesulfovibrionales bacterium]